MRQACRHVISGDSYSNRFLIINHIFHNTQIHSVPETQGDIFRSHFARLVMVRVFGVVVISCFYFVRRPAVLMPSWVSLVPAVVFPLSWIKLHPLIFLPAFSCNTTAGPGKVNRDTLQNKTGNKAAPKTLTMTHPTPKKPKKRFAKQQILEPDHLKPSSACDAFFPPSCCCCCCLFLCILNEWWCITVFPWNQNL